MLTAGFSSVKVFSMCSSILFKALQEMKFQSIYSSAYPFLLQEELSDNIHKSVVLGEPVSSCPFLKDPQVIFASSHIIAVVQILMNYFTMFFLKFVYYMCTFRILKAKCTIQWLF